MDSRLLDTKLLEGKVRVFPLKSSGAAVRERLTKGVSELLLAPGQSAFVGEPAMMLAAAIEDPERHPFAILAPAVCDSERVPDDLDGATRGPVIGMGVIHMGAAMEAGWPDNGGAVLLRGFVIDRSQQGLGYGTGATMAAVDLAQNLVSQLKLPASGVVLGVNERNLAGWAAYLKAGFVDHGRYLGGRSGPQRTLYRPFAKH